MRHLFKKLIVWTLCLAMAVGMLPRLARGAKAAEPDAGASTGIAWNDEKVYYEISSYEGLLEFAKIVNGKSTLFPNNSGANAILTGEIDASASSNEESKWTPIGTASNPYKGTFDGQKFKIEGLTTNNESASYVGLFGCVGKSESATGSVINVGLIEGSITGKNVVGGVVGFNAGTVTNCYNTSAATGSDYSVGGVVGENAGTVTNCYNTGKVIGNGYMVGGVVGDNIGQGTVTNCHNIGTVTGKKGIVGGVVGSNSTGKVSSCYNTGTVTGEGIETGGVVGMNSDTVSNCYNTGAVKGIDEVGGVVGKNYGTASNCYNTGEVSGNINVGGVVGNNNGGEVSNCYNTGDVSGSGHVGGVAGWNDGEVSDCYNTGAVSGSSYVGGVAGKNPGTVSNCYYNQSTCQKGAIGDGNSGTNVTGLTTAKMTGENALSNMYLSDSIWLTKAHGGSDEGQYYLYYPQLKGFNYKADGKPETDSTKISSDNWPAKVEVKVSWNEPDSYTYDGSEKNPTVTSIIVGDDSIPDGASVSYSAYGSSTWGEPTSDAPDSPGLYKMECDVAGEKVTKYFSILSPGVDYAVSCLKSVKGKWEQSTESINSGEYKAVISWTEKGHAIIEKTFDILPVPVTLTAITRDTDIYDGTEKTVSGLTCSVEGLTFKGVSANGKGTKPGVYDVTFSGVTVNVTKDTTGNYVATAITNGTLTINKKPLTITASSETKVYDGTALAKDSYTNSGLASGDTIESVTVTGTQNEVGTTDNVPSSAKIVNAAGEDVTGCYDITYVNGTLTVTKPAAPKLADDQKPAPKQDLKEDGKEQVLVLDPAKLPEGYTIEYSTDGGKTWTAVPTGTRSGEYTIEVKYTADGNHTDFFGDTLKVMIQGVYNKTESDGDWTKGSGKTYTFRIKKAFNDEVCFDNFTGLLVDGKQAKNGENYTAVKGSTVITFAADYLETLSVGEHMIRVIFKDGEILLPLKILEAVATPTPAVDATPVTGDTANPFLLVALILVSMAGAAVIIERRRHSTGI